MIERRNELFIAWPPFHEQGRGVYFHFNRFFGSCQHAKIKFWVQPFSKGWQFPKAAPLVARPRGRNPPMIPKDQEGQPKRPGGTFWRRGTLSRGSPQDAVLQKRTNKTRASKKKRQPFRLASAGFRFVFQYRKSHRPFHPSPRPPEPNRKPSGHIGFLQLANAISAPEKRRRSHA